MHLGQQSNPQSYSEGFRLNPEFTILRAVGYGKKTLMAGFTSVRDLGGENSLALRDGINQLMTRAVEAGGRALTEETEPMVISGERNLLGVAELSDNMERMRRLFDLFEKKTGLLRLMDASSRADGVQIFIGGESALVPMDQVSVVVAPYEVEGRIVGTLGVIGPTRMAYERVIPIVDITARLVSSALSHNAA